jgi:putative transposase
MEPYDAEKARRSIRLSGFDYSRIGMYFLTICASRQRCILGTVHGSEIVLSRIGEIVETCWTEIPRHFPNVTIETYFVMPNHLHGKLTIDSQLSNADPQDKPKATMEAFGKPVPNSIPAIIRSFKSAVIKLARESRLIVNGSVWQLGYFERVLRDTHEYVEVTNYILLNPIRWAEDEEIPDKRLDVT